MIKAKAESFGRTNAGASGFWRIRNFLVDTYPISPLGFNWEIRCWDGVMFYRCKPGIPAKVVEHIHLWMDSKGEWIGVLHPEKSGGHWFVHPHHRQLEVGMLAWAEAHVNRQGKTRLSG